MISRVLLAGIAIVLITGCDGTRPTSLPFAPQGGSGAARAHATEKVLYSFSGEADGGGPNGSIVFDASGNAYGTTHFGGITTCGGQVGGGCGVVFELSQNNNGGWSESPLYAFSDGVDGGFPNSGVILDKSGNVLGTASTGGNAQCSIGCGVVYELRKRSTWSESVLHAFTGSDGQFPNAVLLPGAGGALYSTTWYGGTSGNGTVFALTPSGSAWNESVLYIFQGTTDGSAPAAGVVADAKGNLYGTTYKYDGDNDGVAYELRKASGGSWKDRVLYTFSNNGGGEDPYAGLLGSGKGKFYGTAIEGGTTGSGVAFELVLGAKGHWTEKVLHTFGAAGDGSAPYGGLVADPSGHLFGTTVFGGTSNAGTVYELDRARTGSWKERILYSFGGGSDGEYPSGALALDPSGNLFGAASNGGASGSGVVFEITR